MTTPEDKEREFKLRQAELEAKERELKLREMEAAIYQEQKSYEVNIDPPMYRTEKHNPGKHNSANNSIQKFGKKIVKFAKFSAFVFGGIIVIRVGFLVGMWISYLMLAGIIAAIGYQIFLKDDK